MGIVLIIGLLIAANYFGVDKTYTMWVVVGCIFGLASGFCAFSCGKWFQQNSRGARLSIILQLNSLLLAVFLGFDHGAWWGVAAFLAFYPTSYTLALQVMQLLRLPVDYR